MGLCFTDDELNDSFSSGISPLLIWFSEIDNQSLCKEGLLPPSQRRHFNEAGWNLTYLQHVCTRNLEII